MTAINSNAKNKKPVEKNKKECSAEDMKKCKKDKKTCNADEMKKCSKEKKAGCCAAKPKS